MTIRHEVNTPVVVHGRILDRVEIQQRFVRAFLSMAPGSEGVE